MNIAKCGCDCSKCPTYRENMGTTEDRMKCSAGWSKYLNIKLSPDKLRACDGCSIPDAERKIWYLNCRIRKCAMVNGILNCAFCKGFPCWELSEVHSLQNINNKEEFTGKTGIKISVDEYATFIEPYAGLFHLGNIRKTLKEDAIRDYKKYTTKADFAPFTDPADKQENLRIIYGLLTKICVEKKISFARQQSLVKKREQLLKLLWAMACYGKPDENNDSLVLDGKAFLAQKINAMYDRLQEYFVELKGYDIHCEIIPLTDKGWLTPRGGLRADGWMIRLKFGKTLNGIETLNDFRRYVLKLDKKYKKNAYKLFNKADLSIMIN